MNEFEFSKANDLNKKDIQVSLLTPVVAKKKNQKLSFEFNKDQISAPRSENLRSNPSFTEDSSSDEELPEKTINFEQSSQLHEFRVKNSNKFAVDHTKPIYENLFYTNGLTIVTEEDTLFTNLTQ
jgi:hypothetical protein